MNESFQSAIEEAVNEFNNLDKTKVIRVVGHLDADGITASSILIETLTRQGRKFSFSIVKRLDDMVLKELSKEDYPVFFFVDLGSSNIINIKERLKDKTVFVLDHHIPQDEAGVIHVNPRLCNINGDEEISGAGVVYLFCKTIDNEMTAFAHLALIGAMGDMQCRKDFSGLNLEILQDALEHIDVKKGLRMFGSHTRPLHKILEYSTDPYIPGVTGSEENSVNFLFENGIALKEENGDWKKLINLNEDEMKKLVTGIILRRMGSEENPEDIFGQVYILKNEDNDALKDMKEFSTLLNACGRLGKPSLGIGVCLNNKELKKKAIALLGEYKSELIKGLNYFHSLKEKGLIKENEKVVIINFEGNIKETMIGTITSMVVNSNVYKKGMVLIGMGYSLGDKIKISVRYTGREDVDLRQKLMSILQDIDKKAEVGGHGKACGAVIDQDKEGVFIEKALEIFK
jgi:RecJ-like exonuclease